MIDTGIDTRASRTGAHAQPAIVEVRDLVKSYGSTTVLGGLSIEVFEGELFGLLGTNGAGKTTTVEILQSARSSKQRRFPRACASVRP